MIFIYSENFFAVGRNFLFILEIEDFLYYESMEKSKVDLKVNGKNYRLRPKLSEFMVLITNVFEVAFWVDKENKEVTQLDKQVIKKSTSMEWNPLF